MRALKDQILEFDRRFIAWHGSNATSKRLDAIPGVGPALATALVASIADPKAFQSGRDFSAWVRAEAELERRQGTSLAVLANKGIAICAAYSRPVRPP
ncbi:transposase [Bradyrhizobium brasilense]|uniref:transposase n=1 Tax=Bradyrhizobium brasilense TaxID=1419277 RepID=UPI000B010939|nr:transposase [Bradyrhizobium brasilense]